MRYGHLPKGLPEWYDSYDKDKDGQVALHEWRKSGGDLGEFQKFDLNSDGLVTSDEILRGEMLAAEAQKIAAILNPESAASGGFAGGGKSRSGSGGGGFSLPGTAPPSSADKISATNDKDSEKSRDKGSEKGGPNPFRDGGFGKDKKKN